MIRQYFSTLGKGKKLACLVLFVALFVSSYIIAANANTNDDELSVWVLCQPNSYVNTQQERTRLRLSGFLRQDHNQHHGEKRIFPHSIPRI